MTEVMSLQSSKIKHVQDSFSNLITIIASMGFYGWSLGSLEANHASIWKETL